MMHGTYNVKSYNYVTMYGAKDIKKCNMFTEKIRAGKMCEIKILIKN